MHSLKLVVSSALLITSATGLAQGDMAKIGEKQKTWMPANFRSFTCAVAGGSSSALTGSGTVSFEAGEVSGIDLSVAIGNDGLPTISAHAIDTKGTGGTNGRAAMESCPAANASSTDSAPACSLSGDDESPTVRFTVPLAALGDLAAAKPYMRTVTIVKSASGQAATGSYLSKKGYDYYQSRRDMPAVGVPANAAVMVIANCDSTRLTSKAGKPTTVTYDLAVGKKA